MTDRIDLDERDDDEPSEDTEEANDGDWFWRDEDSAADAPGSDDTPDSADASPDSGSDPGLDPGEQSSDERVPHVPREHHGSPVGVPTEQGGAGAGSDDADATATTDTAESTDAVPGVPDAGGSDDGAAAPGSAAHGGDAAAEPSEMTLAFTYRALRSLGDLHAALADAESWTDWLGVVGHVDAHVINKFQRDNRIDLDFFNGSGTGPAERLAAIGPRSMFYAERMVLVGTDGEDAIAEAADWEFVPLAEAAEAAGWELS